MAHVLFIYKQFPAPAVGHAGGESLFGLMTALYQRGHQISLVARITEAEQALRPAVEAICEHVYTTPHHRALSGPRLLAVVRSYWALRHLAKCVLRTLRPDCVHVETTQTALILAGLARPPASFRTQDVNWFLQQQQVVQQRGLRRVAAQLKAWAFRLLEPPLYRSYDIILAISEGDRRLLQPIFETTDTHNLLLETERPPLLLLPLVPAITPEATNSPIVPGYATHTTRNVLFVGAMSRDHNLNGVQWFLDVIWPRILAQVPDAHFYIVGGGPPDALRARADETITVTGFVDDLAPWYQAAEVFVSPLLVAGGLLQKIMDAMAMGVPVVATSVCNHGVSAIPDEHLLAADTPAAFGDAVVALLQSPEAQQRLGVAGQRFIHEHYNAVQAIDQWEAALLTLSANVREA